MVHSAVDDHARLTYSEIHPDERGDTCPAFLTRAAAHFCSLGITRIERVMTDNALDYRRSTDFQHALTRLGARHILIRPHRPWQNGRVKRLNRTLLAEWVYSRVFTGNAHRAALLDWLDYYNSAATAVSAASPRSAACQPPHERLHLAAAAYDLVLGLHCANPRCHSVTLMGSP